jgi:hypothetical protein
VYVSKQVPLRLLGPPNPFHRATGTTASRPDSSASWATKREFSHVVLSAWGAVVTAQPLLTFPLKIPSFTLLVLKRGLVSQKLRRGRCARRSISAILGGSVKLGRHQIQRAGSTLLAASAAR